MEINEKTMEQVLAGIKDLQETVTGFKAEIRERLDQVDNRLDRLEIRQGNYEVKMNQKFRSFDEKLDNLEAGQTTIKGQLSNLQIVADANDDNWEVISQAYLRNKQSIDILKRQVEELGKEDS